jgi:hypothetical protein
MNVTLEFDVKDRVWSYEFIISGESFKEIKDTAKILYAEISETEYGGRCYGDAHKISRGDIINSSSLFSQSPYSLVDSQVRREAAKFLAFLFIGLFILHYLFLPTLFI